MIRVKKSALIYQAGVAYYKHGPFSGIVYTLDNENITKIEKYSDGVAVGPYVNGEIDNFENLLKVDNYYLEGREEPLYYKGVPFNGVAFEFHDDICTGECCYQNGEGHSIMRWGANEQLYMMEKNHGDFFEISHWYGNGKLCSIQLLKQDSFEFLLRLTDNGIIELFQNDWHNFFECSAEIQRIVRKQFITKKDDFKNLFANTTLTLMGKYIDNETFSYLKENAGLDQVQTLLLYEVSINAEEIITIAKLPNIKTIYITDDTNTNIVGQKQAAQRLKNIRNDIEIKVDEVFLTPELE